MINHGTIKFIFEIGNPKLMFSKTYQFAWCIPQNSCQYICFICITCFPHHSSKENYLHLQPLWSWWYYCHLGRYQVDMSFMSTYHILKLDLEKTFNYIKWPFNYIKFPIQLVSQWIGESWIILSHFPLSDKCTLALALFFW